MSSQSQVSIEEFNQFVREELPFARVFQITAVNLDREAAVLCAPHHEDSLRPGGTISGPVMMGLADAALYAVILANIGRVELAVTTNLSINFLRKPAPGDLFCRATILKLGKRLAVCEAHIYSEEGEHQNVVAHVTGTYSIPPGETGRNSW